MSAEGSQTDVRVSCGRIARTNSFGREGRQRTPAAGRNRHWPSHSREHVELQHGGCPIPRPPVLRHGRQKTPFMAIMVSLLSGAAACRPVPQQLPAEEADSVAAEWLTDRVLRRRISINRQNIAIRSHWHCLCFCVLTCNLLHIVLRDSLLLSSRGIHGWSET